MVFPVNIHFGKLEIPLHLVFELLAYTIGFRYFLFLRKKSVDSIQTENRIWILIGAAIGALIGSRLVGIFENPDLFRNGNLQYILGNKTIVGGLLGGLIGVELTKRFVKVYTSSGDLMTYPIILAIMIGRIGCFLEGLKDGTYGTASSLPWAINFGDGIPRHPVNLYEIIFLALLWICMKQLERQFIFTDGSKFKIFLTAYLLFRFMLEFIKPDFKYIFQLGLIQLVCLAGLIYYRMVFIAPRSLLISRTKI